MGLDSLPQPVQIQAMYLYQNNMSKKLLFGDKRNYQSGGGGPTAKGIVGTMIDYCQSRYGPFNEKHFVDIVRRGLRSKYYNHYKEDQA